MHAPAVHEPPAQLASLEGQQYLVLRPAGAVAALYDEVQPAALALESLPHPHTGHVTLRGFHEPARRAELTQLVREWAATQHQIELRAEAIDSFPAPWQIPIVRLARTASLVGAYASLTESLVRTDLIRLGELSLEDWTFHLSIVYAKTLEADPWDALDRALRRELEMHPEESIAEAELVWYEGGIEHAEVIPLGIRPS